MPFPSRPLRLFLAALAIVGGVWGAEALTTQQKAVLLLGGGQQALLGFNMSGAEFSIVNFPRASDWAYAKSQGRTLVRLPIAWENIQPTLSGALASTYLANLKAAVALAHSYGIAVIVDLHNSGCYVQSTHWGTGSPSYTYAGNAGTCPATGVNQLNDGTLTSAAFADLWSRLATALKGTPGLVGYDIMNEPSASAPVLPGTNLLYAPNGFGDPITAQGWFLANSPVVTRLAPGTNPVAGYGPAWHVTSGTGFSFVLQNVTLAATPYTLTCSFRDLTSTSQVALSVDFGAANYLSPNASWQQDTPYTFTPTAGPHPIGFTVNNGAGFSVDVANCQLQAGSSATAYVPNNYQPDAQAAITAIRAVDTTTTIYVEGTTFTAYEMPWVNWEYSQLTGGNLVLGGHQYFCGTVAAGGGAGCTKTYSFYGASANDGPLALAPYVSWLNTIGAKGYIGEFNVPGRAACSSCTISGTVLTVGGSLTGAWDVGQAVTGAGVPAGTVIMSLGSGSGGAGTYNLNNSATIGSGEAMKGQITSASPWYTLQGNLEQYLIANRLPATMWYYNSAVGVGTDGFIINPISGVDDVRVTQMRQISP